MSDYEGISVDYYFDDEEDLFININIIIITFRYRDHHHRISLQERGTWLFKNKSSMSRIYRIQDEWYSGNLANHIWIITKQFYRKMVPLNYVYGDDMGEGQVRM